MALIHGPEERTGAVLRPDEHDHLRNAVHETFELCKLLRERERHIAAREVAIVGTKLAHWCYSPNTPMWGTFDDFLKRE